MLAFEVFARPKHEGSHPFARNDGLAAGIEGPALDNYWTRDVTSGDWIAQVFGSGQLLKPWQVLKISNVSKNLRVLWVAIPKAGPIRSGTTVS